MTEKISETDPNQSIVLRNGILEEFLVKPIIALVTGLFLFPAEDFFLN